MVDFIHCCLQDNFVNYNIHGFNMNKLNNPHSLFMISCIMLIKCMDSRFYYIVNPFWCCLQDIPYLWNILVSVRFHHSSINNNPISISYIEIRGNKSTPGHYGKPMISILQFLAVAKNWNIKTIDMLKMFYYMRADFYIFEMIVEVLSVKTQFL